MNSLSLTPNSISAIVNGNVDLRPLLQVLNIKELTTNSQTRYRLLLSDGTMVHQAVLASQLNTNVLSGKIKQGSILQLIDYVCSTVRDIKVIMVLNLEVIGFSADTIGEPKQLKLQDHRPFNPESDNEASPSKQLKLDGPYKKPTSNSETSPGYAKPVVPQLYEPSPVYSYKGPIAKNQAPAKILPIAALNPYQGRWTIKARVTAKGDLRRFHNAKGDGKVFSFDLIDADGGEIRATCFNAVVDRFIDKIEVGKVYMISKGSLKPAQKNFNHLRNEWEIFLESSSIIEPWNEEDESIPQQQFNFTPIKDLENIQEKAAVDMIGVVIGISQTNTILTKNGTETQKRTVQLRDFSGFSVELTMWGSFCAREGDVIQEIYDSGKSPVVAVKAGRVSDFGGKSVGTISSTQLLVNPDLPEAKQLSIWFESEGKKTIYQAISSEDTYKSRPEMRKTVSQIKDEGLGRSGSPDWIAVKATVSFIKTDKFCYTACPLPVGDKQCNRKVTYQSDGTWHCDRCDKSMLDCEYRYLLSLQIQDHTGVIWVTAFQEVGEEIMGVPAKQLHIWNEEEDPRFGICIQNLLFTQHLFKLKVKEENYNDELSVKCTIVKMEKLSLPGECRIILDLIRNRDAKCSISSVYASPSANLEVMQNGFSPGAKCSTSPACNSQLYNSASKSRQNGFSPNKQSWKSPSSGSSTCFRCGQVGHWSKDCRKQVRKRIDYS